MKTFQILGFTIHSSIENLKLNSKKLIINTINPHCYCEAKKDAVYRDALLKSDILLPDGTGIVWAHSFLTGIKTNRISGYDLFIFLMDKLNKENGSVFFLGASAATLEKIKFTASVDYPNVKVGYYSPPYVSAFSDEDSTTMCNKVNSFNPDILFVGMTAPKQEKWVYEYKTSLNVQTICCIGAVFDFYSGTIKRPSEFWIRLGLEWLPRLFREPRRLSYRNFVSTPKFIIEVFFFKLFPLDSKNV